MKKAALSILVIILFYLVAFNDPPTQVATDQKREISMSSPEVKYQFTSIRAIAAEDARKMVKNYIKKDANKDKGGFASIDPKDLTWLSSQANVSRVFFVQAAYLNDHGESSKRGRPITLIVVEKSAGGRFFEYFESLNLCPPPEGECELEAL